MTATETIGVSAAADTSARPDLLERLLGRTERFDFFQAVWLLERYRPGQALAGLRGPVAAERLRFRPALSMGFPSTDVGGLVQFHDPSQSERNYLLEVRFLGLYGVSTPLPLHYSVDLWHTVERGVSAPTEEDVVAADQLPAAPPDTSPTRDFLDVFHHRLISLFYRAWLKYRYDRQFGQANRDALTNYLLQFIGCPAEFGPLTLGVEPIRLLRYAGALTQRPRSATTLRGVLEDYLAGTPVIVREFIGQWLTLDENDLNRVGQINSGLGVDLTIGEQVYDLSGAFCLSFGPVSWDGYRALAPGGALFSQIRAITKLYCRDPLAFNIEVRLEAGAVPETQLTSDDRSGRLGLTSWVRTWDLGETAETFDAQAEATGAPGVFLGIPQPGPVTI